jgi:hypothetical protein
VSGPGKGRKNPILGAAVLKALLQRRSGQDQAKAQSLYDGVLRDLDLTDEQVDKYLSEHASEVEESIRSHGRRGS